MEIRNVVNDVQNDYPKMEHLSKEHLKSTIPNKWLKVGLSSFVITMMMKNKVLASSLSSGIDDVMNVAGFMPVSVAGDMPVEVVGTQPQRTFLYVLCNDICSYIMIFSFVIFIVTGLNMLIRKFRAKKNNETKKTKKWIKVLFVISFILFIVSLLIGIFANNINY